MPPDRPGARCTSHGARPVHQITSTMARGALPPARHPVLAWQEAIALKTLRGRQAPLPHGVTPLSRRAPSLQSGKKKMGQRSGSRTCLVHSFGRASTYLARTRTTIKPGRVGTREREAGSINSGVLTRDVTLAERRAPLPGGVTPLSRRAPSRLAPQMESIAKVGFGFSGGFLSHLL